jgi:hypothetical protein
MSRGIQLFSVSAALSLLPRAISYYDDYDGMGGMTDDYHGMGVDDYDGLGGYGGYGDYGDYGGSAEAAIDESFVTDLTMDTFDAFVTSYVCTVYDSLLIFFLVIILLL